MFLHAGFNPRGRVVLYAFVRCGDGAPRWTRLWRFACGDLAWVGRRFGWAARSGRAISPGRPAPSWPALIRGDRIPRFPPGTRVMCYVWDRDGEGRMA